MPVTQFDTELKAVTNSFSSRLEGTIDYIKVKVNDASTIDMYSLHSILNTAME